MERREEFLQAIIANREDDGPRLVYADWLEEQGEAARAEFIRVQCELAPLGTGQILNHSECSDPRCKECRRRALRRRADELLLSSVADTGEWTDIAWVAWAGPCAAVVTPGARFTNHLAFRRGFVAELTCTAEVFVGGVCRMCSGQGWWSEGCWPPEQVHCPECDNGCTPGHADALLAAAPLEVVRLTTWPSYRVVEPLCARRLGGDEWRSWSCQECLEALWPGVRFEMPASFREVVNQYTAADWDTPPELAIAERMEEINEVIDNLPAAYGPTPRQQFRQFLEEMNRPPRRPGGRRRR